MIFKLFYGIFGKIRANKNHFFSKMHLFAFDFDQTVINLNSDIVISEMIEDIPDTLKEIRKTGGWTSYMQGVFDYLCDKDITVESISSVIKSLEPTPGMLDAMKQLCQRVDCDVIIISDANSYFIDTWLTHHDVRPVSAVFTNPAQVVDGKIVISMYHLQSSCKLSPKNLCKGQVLQEYIAKRKTEGIAYDKVMYVGDGANDLCPILRLYENDIAFVRENYKCHELLKRNTTVKAKIVYWKTANDIMDVIKDNSI